MSACAERQGTVDSLDYALAAGSTAAEQARPEVEATLRRTSEQVWVLPSIMLTQSCCAVHGHMPSKPVCCDQGLASHRT